MLRWEGDKVQSRAVEETALRNQTGLAWEEIVLTGTAGGLRVGTFLFAERPDGKSCEYMSKARDPGT